MPQETRAKPRFASFREELPTVLPKRAPKERLRDEKDLLDRIWNARAERRITEFACRAMMALISKGDWGTGCVSWSNEVWCATLGIRAKPRKRVRKTNGTECTDRSPESLLRVFRELRALGLADRPWLEPGDSRLIPHTDAWKFGLRATRRLVWDGPSFDKALDCARRGGGPHLGKWGPDPISSDGVRAPFGEMGSGPHLPEGGLPFPVLRDPFPPKTPTGEARGPRETPLASLDEDSVTDAPEAGSVADMSGDIRSRSDTPSGIHPIAAPPREREAGEGGRASPGPSSTPEEADPPRSREEQLARAWLEFRRRTLFPKTPPFDPSPKDVRRVERALAYCAENHPGANLQWVVVYAAAAYKAAADRADRCSLDALLRPRTIDKAIDVARGGGRNVAAAPEAPPQAAPRRTPPEAPPAPEMADPVVTDWAPELKDSIIRSSQASIRRQEAQPKSAQRSR